MRAVIQRVGSAKVAVQETTLSETSKGILTLLGVQKGDTEKDLQWMIDKIVNLRIFPDEDGKMNRSLIDVRGEHLIVSQFTLLGDCRKGRRPAFTDAEDPERAEDFCNKAIELSESRGVVTKSGQFGADMQVSLTNDGPVTLVIDSPSHSN